jgi:hypothetical protein
VGIKPVNREINALLDDLRFLGYAVVDVGQRWRVTSPDGGNAVFVPASSNGRNKDISGVMALLTQIGYTADKVAAAREAERQARMEEDRKKAVAQMAVAERKAAEAQRYTPFTLPKPVTDDGTRRPGVRPLDAVIVTDSVELDLGLAKDLIRMNTFYATKTEGKERNRTVNRDRVIAYAKTMLAGGWLATNQGIGVDVNGSLVDGQKRALALILACEGIVEAGDKIITLPDLKPKPKTTIPMLITWNLPTEAKYAVDMGEFRSVAQQVGMAGESNTNLLSSTVKIVLLHDRGDDWARWNKTAVTAAEIIEKLDTEPELREALKGAALAGNLIVASAANAGYYLCLRAYPGGPMGDFMHGVKTGENLASGDPRLALRNWLQKRAAGSRSQQRRADSAIHLAVFIKAWNEFSQGVRRKDMKFLDEEKFPVPYAPKPDGRKRPTK